MKIKKYKTGITKYNKNDYRVQIDIGDSTLLPKTLNDKFNTKLKAEKFAKRLAKKNNGIFVRYVLL